MDIKLVKTADGFVDINVASGLIEQDDGLFNAIFISLFSDRYDEEEGKGGWWADALSDEPIGSRLWKLARAKVTGDSVKKAKEYAEESLAWMVSDKVASAILVTSERSGDYTIKLTVQVSRPGVESTYSINWDVMGGTADVLFPTYA